MTSCRSSAEVLRQELEDHLSTVRSMESLIPAVEESVSEICRRLSRGGRVFAFGNGGSAADAQHLVAELIGRYLRPRRPLPAISLSSDPSVLTCIANDYTYDNVFARQVTALACSDDVVVAFSTSGESTNVVRGLAAAQASRALTILVTGEAGVAAARYADRVLRAPSSVTARVQESHVVLIHLLSEYIDRWAEDEVE